MSGGEWRAAFEGELLGNILPFWRKYAVDAKHGGFVGALSNDLKVKHRVPRSSVVCARILWTFAAAYRRYGRPEDLAMAQRAAAYLTGPCWDPVHGGVYWRIDAQGRPVEPRKHSYAQAFAIYGLAEYHRATGDAASLAQAQALFALLETHAYEHAYGGYIEGCGPAWDRLADMRLSAREPNCRKSMNTLLHMLEGYTNLLRVWEDARLRLRLRELIDLFLDRVVDAGTHHFRLFFDDDWRALPDHISDGHDIEGSWLLVEAAEVLGDASLLARVRGEAVRIAAAVYAGGLAPDGSLRYERRSDGTVDDTKQWWAQAEAVVGFYNAFQLSGERHFLAAAQGCWRVIDTQFVDRKHGDWFKVLDARGRPVRNVPKIGPWECPYHHGRMCMEMAARL